MVPLSQQLKGMAGQIRANAEQQANVGQAQVGMQTQQAIQAGATQPQLGGKRGAQQLAGAVTQASGQQALQAQQTQQQQLGQLAQQGLQQQAGAQQMQLGKQAMLNDKQISEMQRAGKLRQNSASLKQAKQLQDRELKQQERFTSAKMSYDNRLSFLTRKQREDLANLGAYTKQVLFDQRLTFAQDEAGRKFTNMQQLADYAVLSAEKDEDLAMKLQDMQQANEKEIIALQHAHNMLTSKLKFEFERAEKQKDYALMKQLSEMKTALEEKMRRKAARGAMISNIIVGGATIAGAVIGSGTGPGGAVVGAQIGQAGGQAAAGTAQSQGVY